MSQQNQTEVKDQKFDEKYSKELSAGTYAKKQVLDIIVSMGSIVIGGLVGNYIGVKANLFGHNSAEDFGSKYLPKKQNLAGAGIGALFGSIIGQLIQGFGRWKKHESGRLAVAEINEDVANMKIRDRTDPELLKENDRLREMLDAESQKTTDINERTSPAQKHLEEGKKTMVEHSQTTQGSEAQVS